MAINFNKADFVLSSVKASTFIRDGKPQVTFAGRSNVGKSSVINRLLNRKNFGCGRDPPARPQSDQLFPHRRQNLLHRPSRLRLR